MNIPRSAGVLLHPTSLPGRFGIGDIGPEAYAFVDWLAKAGFGCWQILPLGPTGYGNSPYQCHSVFAGNPNLISPELLVRDGLLSAAETASWPPEIPCDRNGPGPVRFGEVIPWKRELVRQAHLFYEQNATPALRLEFEEFRQSNAGWLDDFALFMALKARNHEISMLDWPLEARSPEKAARAGYAVVLEHEIVEWVFGQWLFFRQWGQLREHAHRRGVRLIGDAPIFAALDSSDVWSKPELFQLDESGAPTVVAGVPPDYFAPTGQRWGNPLYAWAEHKRSGYDWWIRRVRGLLQLVDLVRLDHFRGFASYWEIPAAAPTAELGRWVEGPAEDFLDALVRGVAAALASHDLPLIAEDLGVVTPDVRRLLNAYDLPGMRILQFAFSGYHDDFLPHNYPENCVAYTGTHDNDTSRGWFSSASEAEKRSALTYLASSEPTIVIDMIRAIWRSPAVLAIAPIQDILGMGSEARMNFPGQAKGYWEWRMPCGALTDELAAEFGWMNSEAGRLAQEQAQF